MPSDGEGEGNFTSIHGGLHRRGRDPNSEGKTMAGSNGRIRGGEAIPVVLLVRGEKFGARGSRGGEGGLNRPLLHDPFYEFEIAQTGVSGRNAPECPAL